MKLPSLIDYLYVKIFIAIVEDGDLISIASEIFSGSKKSDESSESFESFKEASEYIQELISDSPYFYIYHNNTKPKGKKIRYLTGYRNASIKLQYIGDGKFIPISFAGYINVQTK